MRRLLVTGGAGFIGANFVHHWLDRHPGDRVVVLDALSYAGNLKNLEQATLRHEYRFVRGDIRDQTLVEGLLIQERIDTIVHLAAESHVDRSISGPDAFFDVNVIGTHCLLKAARSVWLQSGAKPEHRFHHVSTDEVYGDLGASGPAFSESTPYAPNSPYAASKAAADHAVRAYWKTYGLEVTISNCSNNYGPLQHPEKLIPLTMVHLLRGKTVPIYGNGKNVRDWLFVKDHCAGIESILERGQVGRTYNLGAKCERTNLELVDKVCRLTDQVFENDASARRRYPQAWPARGHSCRQAVTFVADRAGHDLRYAINPQRAQDEIGFVPEVAIDDGLRRTVHWYVENERWWQAALDRAQGDSGDKRSASDQDGFGTS